MTTCTASTAASHPPAREGKEATRRGFPSYLAYNLSLQCTSSILRVYGPQDDHTNNDLRQP